MAIIFIDLIAVQLSGNQLITLSYQSHIKKCIVAFDWYKLVRYIFECMVFTLTNVPTSR
jgi:hypothetical protein